MAETKTEAAAAARAKKTPPEFYEADTVRDIADVSGRYSPEFIANNEARGKRIEAIMAAARKQSGTLKFIADGAGYRAVTKRLTGAMVKSVAKVDAIIAELDVAFADPVNKLANDTTFYRGISKRFEDDLNKAWEGRFTDSGFTLVSTVERPLKLYAKIELKAGTPVLFMAPHLPDTALLKRGTSYRVTGAINLSDARVYLVRMED